MSFVREIPKLNYYIKIDISKSEMFSPGYSLSYLHVHEHDNDYPQHVTISTGFK